MLVQQFAFDPCPPQGGSHTGGRLCAAAIITLLLAACSGGGAGGDGSTAEHSADEFDTLSYNIEDVDCEFDFDVESDPDCYPESTAFGAAVLGQSEQPSWFSSTQVQAPDTAAPPPLTGAMNVGMVFDYLTDNAFDPRLDISAVDVKWGNYGPFDALGELAEERYAGKRTPAAITLPLAGSLIDALVFAADDPFETDRKNRATNDSLVAQLDQMQLLREIAHEMAVSPRYGLRPDSVCNDGQSLDGFVGMPIPDTDGLGWILQIDLENCALDDFYSDPWAESSNGPRYSGRLWVAATEAGDDREASIFLGYDRVKIEGTDVELSVSGAERWDNDQIHDPSPPLTSTLVLQSLADDEAVMLDRFRRSPSSTERWYHTDVLAWPQFDGDLFLSDVGRVMVESPVPLRYTIVSDYEVDNSMLSEAPLPDGELRLRGADAITASYTTRVFVGGAPLAKTWWGRASGQAVEATRVEDA